MYNKDSRQVRGSDAEEEVVQIVDRNDFPVDAVPRSVMRAKRLIHRATYIFVFNAAGELFIQKRTMEKDIHPGYWDLAAGGVVAAGESYEESAERELAEELGVTASLTFHFDHYYEDEGNRVWGRVFSCTHEGPFILQPEEIVEGRFLSADRILKMVKTKPFSPDRVAIFHRLREEGFLQND